MDYYYGSAFSRADIERAEYKALRSHGMLVGACMLAYLLLQQFFLVVLMFFGCYEAYCTNPAFQYAASILIFGVASLGAPFFLLSRKKGTPSYWRVLPFNPPQDKKRTLLLVLAGFAVCLAANYAAMYLEIIMANFGFTVSEAADPESSTALDVVMNVLCSAVYAPLVEEFVFRGVIMQPLRRYGEHFAVFASAFIFGLAHGSVTGFVFAFICGLAMGYAAVLTGSLWTGVLIHVCNNLFAVATAEFYTAFPNMGDLPYLAAVYIIFFLGIASFILLALSKSFKFNRPNTVLSKGRRIKAFFISLPMLAAILVFSFFILYQA